MVHIKVGTYLLDGASGITFLAGMFTGQVILMLLGGLASIAALINHADQYITRKRQNK